MKLINLTILLLWAITCVAQSSEILPNNSSLQYSGRIEFTASNVARFSMPSSTIKIKFKGTVLKGTFSAKNFDGDGKGYLYVIVDGKADPYDRNIVEIVRAKQTYTLADNLSDSEHTVELVKMNEYWSLIEFHGFDLGQGEIIDFPARSERLIEYYGDSNPSGWSAWNDKDQGGDNASGAYFTYPGFTARALGADLVNFTAGGFGITPNMGKSDLTRYVENIHINTDQPTTNKWDLENNYLNKTPDVVVINLGANDFYSGVNRDTQKQGWRKIVLEQLRPHYPNAHIVLANSEGWAIGEPADYVDEMIEEFKARGDNNVSYVKFPWLWGQEHAVISEHAGFANILTRHIAEKMNWDIPEDNPYSSFPQEGNLLGNPSFENAILGIRPDGWRPTSVTSEAKFINDEKEAKTGSGIIECPSGSGVHQAVKATRGEQFYITVYAKGNGGKGTLRYTFKNQGQREISTKEVSIETTGNWQKISVLTTEAPLNTWQIDVAISSSSNVVLFDDIQMQYNDVTSTETPTKDLGWNVFPNPATDFIQISSKDNSVINYSIYSELGNKIYRGKNKQLDISKWNKGLYIVHRKDQNNSKKFFKN